MIVRKLKKIYRGSAFILGFSLLIAACNNADQSVNNSTTPTGENADTSHMTTTSTDRPANPTGSTTATKKRGRISAGMQADDASAAMTADNMGIYTRSEMAPMYTGGQSALENYIQNNIEYPQDAIDNDVQGVVTVRFAVDENGNISNVSTVGSKLGYGLEEEAVKVVSNMPKWTPGQVKGKKVKVWRTLPINYQLES